ncbi:MAG: hypothetical protein LKE53_11095 [Oscillospiraceae bacterium]|jgi:hypothetical protein|nr:hypothetical protein [Oscillospiraceae bacterium]
MTKTDRINSAENRPDIRTTEGEILKLADLGSAAAACKNQLISCSSEHIYYAQETHTEGRLDLSLLDRSRNEPAERVLAVYHVTKPDYLIHYSAFPGMILAVLENGGSEAWFLKLDKQTGRELQRSHTRFAGNFASCCALDPDHVLLRTAPSRRDASLFQEYRRHTGFSQAASLYDLKKDCCWSVQDPRICAGAELFPFTGGGEQKLLAACSYGTEAEKRKAYQSRRFLKEPAKDCAWSCTLEDFLFAVEADCPAVPMSPVLQAGTDGLLRFAGQDADDLYFRALHFPTESQHILAVSKHTGAKRDAAQLNLGPQESSARFVGQDGRFFKLTDCGSTVRVQGILNSTVDTAYDKALGRFVTCLEDRFLLLQDVLSDGKDSLLFYHLFDAKTRKVKELDGSCTVQGDTLILL